MSWLTRWLHPRFPDHRGKLVPLAWVDGVAMFSPRDRKLPKEVAYQVRQVWFRDDTKAAYGVAVGAGIFAGVGTMPGVLFSEYFGLGIFGLGGLALVSSIVCTIPGFWLVFLPISRRICARRLVETVLLSHLCPGCGYPLRDLDTASESEVTCPECGATWRREAMERNVAL